MIKWKKKTDLHGVDQHTSQSEWNLLGELFSGLLVIYHNLVDLFIFKNLI